MLMLLARLALIRFNRAAGAVADRWHLLKNLSEALERFLDGQRPSIRETAQLIGQQSTSPATHSSGSLKGKDTSSSEQPVTDQSLKQLVPTERRYSLYQRARTASARNYNSKGTVLKRLRLIWVVRVTPSRSTSNKLSLCRGPEKSGRIYLTMNRIYGNDGKPVKPMLKRCLGKLKLRAITANIPF